MNLSAASDDIDIRRLTAADAHSASDLIAEVFSRDEPLARATGQTRAELATMLRAMGPSAISENLSIAASTSHEIVGVALATVFTWRPPEGSEQLSPNYRAIGKMLGELEAEFEARPAADHAKTVHIHMLAVHRAYRDQDIAEAMIHRCMENASASGFGRIVTDATNPASQRVFEKAGFSALSEIRYDTFEFEGRRVFADIPNAENTLFMSRDL